MIIRIWGPLGIGAAVSAFWVLALVFPLSPQTGSTRAAVLMGGTAYLLLTACLALAARPRFAEDAFGGLDRMYRAHRICGTTAGLVVLTHFVLAPKGLAPAPSAPLGLFAIVLLLVSIAAALNRKLPYDKWRPAHKLMGLVFVLVTLHMVTIPDRYVDHASPAAFLLYGAAGIGVAGLAGSQIKGSRYRYTLAEINHLERATELVLRPADLPMAFRPGQFAFVEVATPGLAEAHPFSISSAPGAAELRFSIRPSGDSSGDWTRRIRDGLSPGAEVTVRGPYGRFDPAAGGTGQVWVAGGIGITPFLSTVRAMRPGEPRPVTLFYAVRSEQEALFLDELRDRVRVVVLESDRDQFATVATLEANLPGALSDYAFYLCGPAPMVSGLRKGLASAAVPASNIHFEQFELR